MWEVLAADVHSARISAVQTVIEDVDGVAYDLSIYNFPSTFHCTLEHLDALFPTGGILAIREPTFKSATQGDRPLVRVDSPTDITFVTPRSSLLNGVVWRAGDTVPRAPAMLATVDAWQQRGNAFFKTSQWFLAAFAYSYALGLDPGALVVRLNRAEAYLRLGYFSGAQYDAQKVLSTRGIAPSHVEKALFRLAKAQYGRRYYRDAARTFLRWKENNPGAAAADSWINKCRSRQHEGEKGQYDWAGLYRAARSQIRLDVADFVGPIKVSSMAHRGGGRGVVTTRDVQVGELLVSTHFSSMLTRLNGYEV